MRDAMNKDMDVMTDKNAMPVVLNGTPNSPDALAKIFWMKNTGEVYVDPTNLPQTPAGMQYQLWAIVDGKPLDAGMISTEKGIYHIQKMKTFGKAAGICNHYGKSRRQSNSNHGSDDSASKDLTHLHLSLTSYFLSLI
ncbi:MAG: anti-sigma factor [Chitinophagaceae bacterium]